MQLNRSGFTLVELIVVVVILSVLSTIGFISYANYMSSVRDTKRVGDLVVIHDGLQTAVTNGDLPLPDNYVTINAGGTLVGYQGYAGLGTLIIAGVQNGGMDPKNESYYGYYLYKDRKSVQLMAWLEDSPDKLKSNSYEIPNVVPTTYASTPDYVNRYPKVYGRQLGILTDSLNIPVQDTVTGTLDIATTTNTYVSYYDDTTKVTGTGGSLITSLPNASCKRIRDTGNSVGDGVYRIDPQGNGGFDVWCDMTTNGGGRTLLIKIDGSTNDFDYDASYWTTIQDINQGDITLSLLNAKYDSYNYIPINSLRAVFPNLSNHTFLYDSVGGKTALSFFQTTSNLDLGNWNLYYNSAFPQQLGYQHYGFNLTCFASAKVRWGWMWNNENDCGSNDSSAGIGLKYNGGNASASAGGWATCCATLANGSYPQFVLVRGR